MAADTDEAMRSALRELATSDVPPPEVVYADVRRRVAARRRRRLIASSCAAVAVVAAGAMAYGAVDDGGTQVGTDEPPATAGVGIDWIGGRGGPDGTEEVVIVFDGELPGTSARLVDDVAAVDVEGIAYAIQGPSPVRVCGDTHFFGGSFASVDVLVPAAWLRSETPKEEGVRTLPAPGGGAAEPPGKVVVCAPRDGYVQVSIWGAASGDADDVRVGTSDDRTRLSVEIDRG